MKDLDLSIAQFSAFGSFATLGAAIGALFCGNLAMVIGRRGVINLTISPFIFVILPFFYFFGSFVTIIFVYMMLIIIFLLFMI
jgi:MFS-type transporter involved in bile tolerance (Atg22 family)